MSTNSKLSFVERVMALLTGGDLGKVERFHKNTIKHWERQIKLNKDLINKYDEEIEEEKEKLGDVEDLLQETIYNVNPEKIQSTELTKAYIEQYTHDIRIVEKRGEAIEDRIKDIKSKQEDCKVQIARFEKLISYLK
jgi:hypothetical protein